MPAVMVQIVRIFFRTLLCSFQHSSNFAWILLLFFACFFPFHFRFVRFQLLVYSDLKVFFLNLRKFRLYYSKPKINEWIGIQSKFVGEFSKLIEVKMRSQRALCAVEFFSISVILNRNRAVKNSMNFNDLMSSVDRSV